MICNQDFVKVTNNIKILYKVKAEILYQILISKISNKKKVSIVNWKVAIAA